MVMRIQTRRTTSVLLGVGLCSCSDPSYMGSATGFPAGLSATQDEHDDEIATDSGSPPSDSTTEAEPCVDGTEIEDIDCATLVPDPLLSDDLWVVDVTGDGYADAIAYYESGRCWFVSASHGDGTFADPELWLDLDVWPVRRFVANLYDATDASDSPGDAVWYEGCGDEATWHVAPSDGASFDYASTASWLDGFGDLDGQAPFGSVEGTPPRYLRLSNVTGKDDTLDDLVIIDESLSVYVAYASNRDAGGSLQLVEKSWFSHDTVEAQTYLMGEMGPGNAFGSYSYESYDLIGLYDFCGDVTGGGSAGVPGTAWYTTQSWGGVTDDEGFDNHWDPWLCATTSDVAEAVPLLGDVDGDGGDDVVYYTQSTTGTVRWDVSRSLRPLGACEFDYTGTDSLRNFEATSGTWKPSVENADFGIDAHARFLANVSADDRLEAVILDTSGSWMASTAPYISCQDPIDRDGTDHTYTLCTSRVTWDEARNACRSAGMDLVSIDDEAENEWVLTTIDDWLDEMDPDGSGDGCGVHVEKLEPWIGYHFSEGAADWRWSDEGTSSTWTNWEVGEPNNLDTEHCTELYLDKGTWNNTLCDELHLWICESTG